MGMLSKIKQVYLQKTGKIKKKWPIIIRVYRKVDDNQYVLTQVTRGRSALEEKEGPVDKNVKLEIMDTNLETKEVPYKYFTNRKDAADELEIIRHTRTSFSPLKTEIKSSEDEKSVEKIYDIEEMKKTALNDFEHKTNVVENDDEHWIHDKRVHALIIFMGAGLFFVMLGIGYSRVITEPVLNKLNNLDSASQNLIPLIGLTGRNKLHEVKNKF